MVALAHAIYAKTKYVLVDGPLSALVSQPLIFEVQIQAGVAYRTAALHELCTKNICADLCWSTGAEDNALILSICTTWRLIHTLVPLQQRDRAVVLFNNGSVMFPWELVTTVGSDLKFSTTIVGTSSPLSLLLFPIFLSFFRIS
jgi:hypothetical protein